METGLLLLGMRYYDVTVGRFINSDPAKAGINWYNYCRNNPLMGIDPSGLDVTVGEIVQQLAYGSTWSEGLATSWYALANLATLGHAYGNQSGRPGFGASQVAWGTGGVALACAGGLAAAPIVASNSLYVAWAAGEAGAVGTVGLGSAGESKLGKINLTEFLIEQTDQYARTG